MGSSSLKREIFGIALLLFAIFLAGALASLGMAEWRTGVSVEGSVGAVGSFIVRPLVLFFGWPAALLIPFVPAVHAIRLFGRLESETDRSWLIFFAGLVALVPIALALAVAPPPPGLPSGMAGIWGEFIKWWWQGWFGSFGAWVLVVLMASVLMAATLSWNPVRALIGRKAPRAGAVSAAVAASSALDEAPPKRRKKREQKSDDDFSDLALSLEPPPDEMPAFDAALMATEDLTPIDRSEDVAIAEPRSRKKKSKTETSAAHDAEIVAAIEATAHTDASGEELPSPELLAPIPPRNADASKRELDAMGVKLMDALRTFKVDGELVGRTTGPVVSQFEVEPAPGVKVRQFANLSNDLALAMRAASIRVVAPIPGRGAVGVEVPNPISEIVSFRELIESRDFQSARAALPIALGKDLEGKPVIADLAKMPHLLIAGATGSGKSVCVNTIITSLVYRHTPRTLRFLMVDPKMVELSVYNTLPHLRHKVITDNRDAASVLKWAVLEMQDRYELLAANGCRNIQDFNKRVQDGAPLKLPKNPNVAFEDATYTGSILPYIVVVIDEMADLMMTVQNEVETPIAMLAQKARAIGIHLILATQRPSVNVITGLIKANFPSRIAFRVASQIDSRTIIDGAGAEMLLGNGDMLFIPPGKSEPSRLQGAYLSSEETEQLMGWYDGRRVAKREAFAAQGITIDETFDVEPDILETVRLKEAEAGQTDTDGGEDAGDRDKLFRDAAEIVVQNQQGSTSLLQRRLKVGYGRAARIIDQLHAAGVLGPPDGSKPREVLVGLDQLDHSVARARNRIAAALVAIGLARVANAQAPVRAGQFAYQTTLERGASTTIIGMRTVTLSQSTYGGSPAWLLLETRTGDGIFANDSLFLDLTARHPIHWSSTLGDARVAAEFRGDTAFAGVTSPVGRRSMVLALRGGALVNAAMLETVLRLEPLQTAWEDSASMLSVSLGGNQVLPTRLSVIGDDRVHVPAGTFDCWVVAVHADPARGLYWVTKQNPMVVRSTVDVPTLGGAQLVNSLIRATP